MRKVVRVSLKYQGSKVITELFLSRSDGMSYRKKGRVTRRVDECVRFTFRENSPLALLHLMLKDTPLVGRLYSIQGDLPIKLGEKACVCKANAKSLAQLYVEVPVNNLFITETVFVFAPSERAMLFVGMYTIYRSDARKAILKLVTS